MYQYKTDVNRYKTKQDNQNNNKNILLKHIIVILILVSIIMSIVVLKTSGNVPENHKEIRIEKGQTLWEIANKHNSQENDIRKLIFDIKELNELNSAMLQPGDTLLIPEQK